MMFINEVALKSKSKKGDLRPDDHRRKHLSPSIRRNVLQVYFSHYLKGQVISEIFRSEIMSGTSFENTES